MAAIAAATARDRVLIAAYRRETVDAGDQVQALLDLARALRDAGIPFALIGGIAVGIHSGSPRATLDVDVAVPSSMDIWALDEALTSSGFEARGRHQHSVNFRHRSGEPVQIAMDQQFDAMIERAEAVEVGETTIPIVTKDDLIAMKERAAADPSRRRSKALRDAADVELLKGDVASPDEGW